jgi:hypothetical protein
VNETISVAEINEIVGDERQRKRPLAIEHGPAEQ